MSVYRATPSIYSRAVNYLRDRLIRRGTSRLVTGAYARIGFADRTALAAQLNRLDVTNINHDLLVDKLVEQGVLKGRFRHEVLELNQIEPFMLKATPPGRLEINDVENFPGLDVDPLFASNYGLVSSISRAVHHSFYSIIQYQDNESLANAFAIGAKAAKGIGITLGIVGAAWFIGSMPVLTPGLVLAGLTATCVLAAKFNDKLPLHGKFGKLGSIARFASRRVAPWLYAADGLYMGYLVFEANLRITSIFNSIGLEGTTAVLFGLGLAGYTFLKGNLKAFNKSYGGQLDPGMQKYMKRMMTGMALSTAGELHYIGTRLLLFGGASAYLLLNTIQNLGPWGAIPLAIPLLGAGATIALHGRKDVTYENKKQADRLDHMKVWAPLWGLATGLAAACIQGVAEGSWFSPIAYTTLYGSFATLFLNEMHGAFHSINTNLGGMHTLRASAKDLVGEREKRDLSDHRSMLIVNPHTGLVEHSYGLLFSVLINKKPGASFVCMYDLICAQTGNRDNHRLERKFVAEVKRMQGDLYQRLRRGIQRGQQLEDNYRQLIANLRGLADHFDNGLQQAILQMAGQHSEMVLDAKKSKKKIWFFPLMEIAEARRAIFEQMSIRGQDFSKLADQLEAQVARAAEGYISEANFYQQWNHLLRCYDPDFVTTTLVARKSVAGDEKMIRKVENVASGLLLRGLTVYKGYFIEEYDNAAGEVTRDPFQNEDWISGTWTAFPNPQYRYDAPAGSQAAAKYIWISRDHVLTELHRQNVDFLSTSSRIASVVNTPTLAEGFSQGQRQITILVNGQERTINAGEYFYSQNPDQVPTVKRAEPRPGLLREQLRGYRLAWDNQRLATFNVDNLKQPELIVADPEKNIDQLPLILRPPAFDFTLMMDKNDVQVNPDLLPTILERARRDIYLHLMLRYPVDKQYDFVNPHPDKEIDLAQGGIQVIDTTFEMSHTTADGREFMIPVKIDRFAVSFGVNDSMNNYRESLSSARVIMENGQPTYFSLTYRGVPKGAGFGKFQHGAITKNDLTGFGNRADAIWKALVDNEYITEANDLGLIQAKFYERPEQFRLGQNRAETQALERILRQAPRAEHIWHALHRARILWETEFSGGGIKDDFAIIQESFDPDNFSMPGNFQPELVEEVSGILQSYIKEMALPPRYYPQFWSSLELPANGEVRLSINNFMRQPHREGEAAWIMIPYTDGTVSFARTVDGDRPMLANKDHREHLRRQGHAEQNQ